MPYSFTQALHAKFGEDINQGLGTVCEIFVIGSSRSTPDGKIMVPRVLTLSSCGIESAGCQEMIGEMCRDVEELDLTQNQLSSLHQVDRIIAKLPNLLFLNLSHNDMEDTEPEEMGISASVRSLVLNHTHIPWNTLTSFLDAMPNLQELHLSLNNYESVQLDLDKMYPNVKRLHVSKNPLSNWDDIVGLGHSFPSLESLVMVDCNVMSIPDPLSWKSKLSGLRSLNMSNGPLNSWEDIDMLNGMDNVDDFRLLGVPFLENLDEKGRRQHLIARLPKAVRLNGSEIHRKEREDAERAFIRYFRNKEEKPNRFSELEAIHGKLQPLVEIDLTPKTVAEIQVRYCEDLIKIMKIDLEKTVWDLKTKLAKLCGLPVNKLRLFYLDNEIPGVGPEEMKYNSKKLYAYKVQDGDAFIVDSKL